MKTKNLINTRFSVIVTTSLCLGALFAGQVEAVALKADFNGDGYEDLVVGVKNEDIGVTNAGAVKVVYGRADGNVSRGRTTYIHQYHSTAGGINVSGRVEAYDEFGNAAAVGDFNRDGYDDLAIGVKNEDVGSLIDAGVVNIIYGSQLGLQQQKNHLLNLQKYKNGQHLHAKTRFGSSLAVGDFDGDGIDDLAVGYLGSQSRYGLGDGGAFLFFGDRYTGLKNAEYSKKTYMLHNPSDYFHAYDGFGAYMVSGDFNFDGIDDLAISAYLGRTGPYDRYNPSYNKKTGTVSVYMGVRNWYRDARLFKKIIPNIKEDDSWFGFSLTVGNFKGDGADELAIGMPRYDNQSGAAIVVEFVKSGRYTWTRQTVHRQSDSLIPGSSKKYDQFGSSLTACDFNDDGYDELGIGVPSKTKTYSWWDPRSDIVAYGEAVVLYNNRNGVYSSQVWHQGTSNVDGGRESHDRFGSTLSAGDFNNDGICDLLVGVQYEGIEPIRTAGIIQLVKGSYQGLTVSGSYQQIFHQGSFQGAGFGANENESYDQFGSALLP